MESHESIENCNTEKYALPWDRLAAFLVDLVFLFPFIQILQAPWRRSMHSAMLIENNAEVGFLAVSYTHLTLPTIYSV